jgi:hypothetical protein
MPDEHTFMLRQIGGSRCLALAASGSPSTSLKKSNLRPLIAEAKKLGEEINALLLPLVAARKNWLRARNEANRQTLDALQAQADALAARHAVLLEEMQRVSGIPEEVFGAMEKARIRGNADDRISRGDLTAEKVTKTGDIDKFLPTALEEILRLIDPSWVKSGRCWINGLGLR